MCPAGGGRPCGNVPNKKESVRSIVLFQVSIVPVRGLKEDAKGIFMRLKATILGVSLVHGHFQAMVMEKGQIGRRWECPRRIETPDHIRLGLEEAIQATDYQGRKVSFLVEESRFTHQYIQTPPMKQADLEWRLARRAEEEKVFDGPAVWRYRRTQPAKGTHGVLLDIWPHSFVNDLVKACEELNLVPHQLLPLSAVFMDQVRALPVEPDDVVLLVSYIAGKIALVVARGDGTPLFDRFLLPGDDVAEETSRIGKEISRSILYAGQHFGVNVVQVWVMGSPNDISSDAFQEYVSIPVLPSPIVPDLSYWIWVGITLPKNHPANFVPREVRLAPFRHMMFKVSVGLAAGIVLATVSATGLMQGIIVREQGIVHALAPYSLALAAEKQWIQDHTAHLQKQQAQTRVIVEERVSPIPGFFLGYLANILPQTLVLEQVAITREGRRWKIELAGNGPSDLMASMKNIAQLERQLVDGPYHVSMTKNWKEGWLNQKRSVERSQQESQRPHFEMMGWIQ